MARRSTTVVAVGLAALSVAAPASAEWLLSGSGTATASATALTATGQPTAAQSATNQDVTVSWTTTNPAPTRYSVLRRHTTTGATTSAECVASPCLDPAVPAGSYTYTVTPKLGTDWTGSASPTSQTLTVTDKVGPTVTPQCPPVATPPPSYTRGSNGTWVTTCAGAVRFTASDTGGMGTVSVSVREGDGKYLGTNGNFNSNGEVKLAPTSSTAGAYSLTISESKFTVGMTYAVTIYASDTAGNTTTTPYSFIISG